MLSIILIYLRLRIAQIFPDVEIKELAELQKVGEGEAEYRYPYEYCSNGEWQEIDFDNYKALIYIRKNGDATITELDEDDQYACGYEQQRRYPMRLVGYFPKDYYNTDNAFIDGKLTENLINLLTQSTVKALNVPLKANKVQIKPSSINTIAQKVYEDEMNNAPKLPKTNHSFFAIDFEIIINGNLSCFEYWACNDVDIEATPDEIIITERGVDCLAVSNCPVVVSILEELENHEERIEALEAGGGGITCDELAGCQTIIDINDVLTDHENRIDAAEAEILGLGGEVDDLTNTVQDNYNSLLIANQANANEIVYVEDVLIPTTNQAVLDTANAYTDSVVVGLWKDQGNYDASGNTFPTAANTTPVVATIKKGFIWTISVAGVLGGVAVNVGDTVRALTNTPAQTASNWAIGESNIGYVPENAANKDASGGYAGLSGFSLKLKNALGTVTSLLSNSASVARSWLLPDNDGTIAMTSDITGINSGTNTGDETAARIAAINHGTAVKTTLVDADEITGQDSATSFSLIRVTCLNIYNYLKPKFDLVYQLSANRQIVRIDTDATRTSNAYGDVIDTSGSPITMQFSVISGNNYSFDFKGLLTCSTANGIFLALNFPSGTMAAQLRAQAAGTNAFVTKNITATDTGSTNPCATSSTLTADYTIWGTFKATANGFVTLRMKANTNGDTCTVKAGSFVDAKKI